MTNEIRRRRTSDPEMDALMVITQALEELDPGACKRVLGWASQRYVDSSTDKLHQWTLGLLKAEGEAIAALNKIATDLALRPPDILRVALGLAAAEEKAQELTAQT